MAHIAVTKQTISLDAAQKMVERALEHARTIGKSVSVAIVDEAGSLMAFGRLDAANSASVNIAIDKAFTAATSRLATHRWQEIMKEDEPLRIGAPSGVDRLIVFGGGQPIVWAGNCIGAIGVSGGHWTGDTEIGSQALLVLEELASGERA